MDVLGALRIQLDGFCQAEASLRSRYAAGLATVLPLTELHRSHPLFSRPESYAAAREALGSAQTPESARPYLRRWVLFLAEQVLAAAAAPGDEERFALEAQQRVTLPLGTATFVDAEAALEHEPSRERRARTESALSDFLLAHSAPYARAIAGVLEMLPALGPAAATELFPESPAARAEDCEALLRGTEDAYRDVLGFALRRIEPQLRAPPVGDASRHDLRYAAQTPWMRTHFAPADALPAITRCTQDWGLHPTASGRIDLDVSIRPGKTRRPAVFSVGAPDDVRLCVRLSHGGQAEYAALLEATGQAMRLAHVPERGSVEVRRLPERTSTLAQGLAWRMLLTLEGWHRRYLGATKPASREAARLAALFLLADLRAACARRLHAPALVDRGPSPGLAEAYRTRMGDALCVQVPRGDFLRDTGSLLAPGRVPESWARAGELLVTFETHFNEDFYRNPACGPWLQAQWQGEGRALVAPAPQPPPSPTPSLVEMGARLVRVLGA